MLFSLALILLLGLIMGKIFEKFNLPALLGMIVTGIVIGPFALNLLDDKILSISGELREIALIIILMRAGLSLNFDSLKKAGRPALLMCFIPACFEIIATAILAPLFFDIAFIDAILLGCVIAAVSPAVIVPKMIDLMKNNYGEKNSVPQIIMASSCVDDIFVITLFSIFLNASTAQNNGTNSINLNLLFNIPVSIITGALMGFVIGIILCKILKNFSIRDSSKVIILLSVSFLLLALEDVVSAFMGFSALLAIMALGGVIRVKNDDLAIRLSEKFSKLWVFAQIILFVLVGANVNISYAMTYGLLAVLFIFAVLVFRILGVFICLLKSDLSRKERLFIAISYLPKATVQAAIGGIPLSVGVACGDLILTIAVLSILITAPLGAILIDKTYKKLLDKSHNI